MGFRRLGLFAVALLPATLSVAYDQLAAAAQVDVFIPRFWAAVFLLAGVLIALVAIEPRSRPLYMAAGTTLVVGLCSRPGAVAITYASGFTRSGWSVVVATIVYGSLAVLAGAAWVTWVGPWHVRHEAGVLAPGD